MICSWHLSLPQGVSVETYVLAIALFLLVALIPSWSPSYQCIAFADPLCVFLLQFFVALIV